MQRRQGAVGSVAVRSIDWPQALAWRMRQQLLSPIGSEPVEGVVLQDLPLDPLGDGRTPPRTDQQDDLAVGHRSQQSLEQVGAEEAGRAGDEQPLSGECLTDHGGLSTTW